MRNPRVLVIDHDEVVRQELRFLLNAARYRPSVAADGASGLALAADDCPDLVILGIDLPAGDGYEVIRRFRHCPELAASHILVMTDKKSRRNRLRAMAAGATAFFSNRSISSNSSARSRLCCRIPQRRPPTTNSSLL